MTKLERTRRRLQKRIAAAQAAQAHVLAAVPEPLDIPDFLHRNGNAAPKVKRKRTVKAKAVIE